MDERLRDPALDVPGRARVLWEGLRGYRSLPEGWAGPNVKLLPCSGTARHFTGEILDVHIGAVYSG